MEVLDNDDRKMRRPPSAILSITWRSRLSLPEPTRKLLPGSFLGPNPKPRAWPKQHLPSCQMSLSSPRHRTTPLQVLASGAGSCTGTGMPTAKRCRRCSFKWNMRTEPRGLRMTTSTLRSKYLEFHGLPETASAHTMAGCNSPGNLPILEWALVPLLRPEVKQRVGQSKTHTRVTCTGVPLPNSGDVAFTACSHN